MVHTWEKSLRTLSFKAGQLLSDVIHDYFSAEGEKSFFTDREEKEYESRRKTAG
jgi:hypothetical protein